MGEADLAEEMRTLADVLVDVTRSFSDEFDYSEESVSLVDSMIEDLWPDRRPWRRGKPDRGVAKTMAPVIGAYIGEVMVRNLAAPGR